MNKVAVLGSYVQDHCWSTERLPAPGESRIGRFSTGPGGKGFNQAVAAHRLGVATLFVGALGRDPLGETARNFALAEQLRCIWMDTDCATAASSIIVDANGGNQIVVALGANGVLPAQAAAAATAELQVGDVLVSQLETALSPVADALQAARRAGALTLLNPAPINTEVDSGLINLADVLTPNETEFMFLVEHLLGVTNPANPIDAADAPLHSLCRRLSPGTVAITLGGDGVFVSHPEGQLRGDLNPFHRIPAAQVSPCDTTGAGDAFSGALAAAIASAPEAAFAAQVAFACRAAGLSTEGAGTAPAMATRDALRERFGEAADKVES